MSPYYEICHRIKKSVTVFKKYVTVLRCPSAAANSKGEQLSKPAVRIEGPNLTNCSFDETTILRDQNNLAAWAKFRKRAHEPEKILFDRFRKRAPGNKHLDALSSPVDGGGPQRFHQIKLGQKTLKLFQKMVPTRNKNSRCFLG